MFLFLRNLTLFFYCYRLEIKFIRRTSMIKGFSTALTVFTERFILFATIVTFVVMGGEIRSGITFSLVQYFNLMQLACNICFPLALSFLAETKVSIRRLEVCYVSLIEAVCFSRVVALCNVYSGRDSLSLELFINSLTLYFYPPFQKQRKDLFIQLVQPYLCNSTSS